MSKLSILWLAIASFLTSIGILIFDGAVYHACFDPHLPLFAYTIPYFTPKTNCLITVFSITFLLMFLGPLLLTLCIYGIYVIIFNRPMPFVKNLAWFSWLIFAYYCIFKLYLLPIL